MTDNNNYFLEGAGLGPVGGVGVGVGGTSKTAAEFRSQSTFSGWDFSTIWKMGSLYPLLR